MSRFAFSHILSRDENRPSIVIENPTIILKSWSKCNVFSCWCKHLVKSCKHLVGLNIIVLFEANWPNSSESHFVSYLFLAALAALYLHLSVSEWLMIINLSDPPMSNHYLTFLTKPLQSWEQISSHFRISTLFYLAVRILQHCFLWVRKLEVI